MSINIAFDKINNVFIINYIKTGTAYVYRRIQGRALTRLKILIDILNLLIVTVTFYFKLKVYVVQIRFLVVNVYNVHCYLKFI